MTSMPFTQARALVDTCLSLPHITQLVSKFYISSLRENCHLNIAMTFSLVSLTLSSSPSNSSFPVYRVPILPCLQASDSLCYSIRAKLWVWYSKFFHNLDPHPHCILCKGLSAVFRNTSRPLHSCFFSSLACPSPLSLLSKYQFILQILSPLECLAQIHPSIHPFTNVHWRPMSYALQRTLKRQ